jgi:hypothetical protein
MLGSPPLIFNIAMAEIESIAEPDCVADDIWRESVALVGIHQPILLILARLFISTRLWLYPRSPLRGPP